jgi:GAF domain-containing protein
LRVLLDDALAALEEHLQVEHAKVLLVDSSAGRAARLYTDASRGYEAAGVGTEIPRGQGVSGVAAREGVPIRIMHATSEYTYNRTAREQWIASGAVDQLETEIPLPGLAQPASQLAVPIVLGRRTVGVLYVESEETARFTFEDEDALLAIATHLGATIAALQTMADSNDEAVASSEAMAAVLVATPGAIGYIESTYIRAPIQAAALQNRLGQFMRPDARAAAKAVASIPLDNRLLGTNPDPADGYPIVNLNWMLVPAWGLGDQLPALKTSLRYILSREGQDNAELLGYVALPPELREKALNQLGRIRR